MTDEPDLINRLVSDNSLVRLAREYVVDLWVYDDHFAAAKLIKVGNWQCHYSMFYSYHNMLSPRLNAYY